MRELRSFLRRNVALSRGDRLICLNSVLSSMSLYFMSFYYLPEYMIHGIDCIRRAFFWKCTRDIHGGFCLINWRLVCSHKSQSGLGVYNLWTFNLPLLAKWWWRLFMIHIPNGFLLSYIITIEDEGYITCLILFLGMFSILKKSSQGLHDFCIRCQN